MKNINTSLYSLHFQGHISLASSMKAVMTALIYFLKSLFILKTLWFQWHGRNFLSQQCVQVDSLACVHDWLSWFKESNRLPCSPSPIPLSEQQGKNVEGVLCTSSLPHTLLHQALLGLVGLRMEHDDRQKQSSAPPCSAVFYTARAWKGCYEAYNRQW